MVDPTDIEKKSLEAHVELCAERYRHLDMQFQDVKREVGEVKDVLAELRGMIKSMAEERNTQLITWGTAIIAALCGSTAWLLLEYINK